MNVYRPYENEYINLYKSYLQLNFVMSKLSGPGKFFDIGMVRNNQLGIMGSQNISFKKNAYLQASFYRLS